MFDNIHEDFRAHDRCWSRQGFWTLLVYRFGRWRYSIRWRPLRMPFSFAYKLLKVCLLYTSTSPRTETKRSAMLGT